MMSMVEHGKDDAELRGLRREIADLKKTVQDSAVRIESLEKDKEKADEAVAALKEDVKCLSTDKRALQALVISYQKIETNLNAAMAKSQKDHFAESGRLESDLEAAREELRLSREENLKSFEDGYQACWARANHHGYAMGDHTFVMYCEELARERDGAASSTRVAAKSP